MRKLPGVHTAAQLACQEWPRLGSTSSSFIHIRASYDLTWKFSRTTASPGDHRPVTAFYSDQVWMLGAWRLRGLNTYTGMRRLRRPHINRCKKIAIPYFAPQPPLEPLRVLRTPTSFACPGWRDVQRKKHIYRRETSTPFPHWLTQVYRPAMFFRRALVWIRC